MTDPSLALGTTLAMVAFWQRMEGKHVLWGYVFFVALGICLLAKGPIGIVLTGLPIFLWVLRYRLWKALWTQIPWVTGTILMLVIALPWYIVAEIRTPGFLHYFIVGEHWQRFLVKGWKGDLYGSGRARPIGTIWGFALLAAAPFTVMMLAKVKTIVRQEKPDQWQFYLWCWVLAPLIFFTLARNILFTYSITALPAFAILTAYYIRERVIPWLVITPVVAIILLIGLTTGVGAPFVKSQRGIIREYHHQRQDEESALLYFGERPYSADFYSAGKALQTNNISEAAKMMKPGTHNFLAVAESHYEELPQAFKNELVVVVRQDHTLLLTRK